MFLRLPHFAVALGFGLFAAQGAIAVDVVNEDEEDRQVVIIQTDGETGMVLQQGETASGVCESCVIEVEGVGSIEAEGEDVIVIRDGRLSKRT